MKVSAPLLDRVQVTRLLSLPCILCVACALPQDDLDHIQLQLSPTANFREAFRLDLQLDRSGAVCRGQIAVEGDARQFQQTLSRAEVESVMQALQAEGIWALKDGDSGEPEEAVLYTRLTVEWGTGRSVSRWRGLPPPQARIARALLDSPLGPTLRQGLEAVQRRKSARDKARSDT